MSALEPVRPPATSPLSLDRCFPDEADVLVIGGGAIGLCTAYFVQATGRHVTVVDRSELGRGSTGGNAGHIVPSHVTPLAAPGVISQALKWMLANPTGSPFGVTPRLSPDLLLWLWRFRAAATAGTMEKNIPVLRGLCSSTPALFADIIQEEHIECFHEQRGLLNVYKTRDGFAQAVKEAHLLRNRGVNVEVLDQDAVRTCEPALCAAVLGAVHFRDDSHLDPARFLDGLTEALKKRGVALFNMTDVIGFEGASDGTIRKVKTTRGDMRVNDVVVAAGAWSGQCVRPLGIKLCLQSGKGFSVTFRRPDRAPQVPMILGEPKVAVTAFGPRLRGTARLEVTSPNLVIRERWLRRIESAMRDYLDIEGTLPVVERWAGLRPLTPDGIPLIGRADSVSNLIIATGHAMLGLTLGPVTGKIVAQLLSGEVATADLDALRPLRF